MLLSVSRSVVPSSITYQLVAGMFFVHVGEPLQWETKGELTTQKETETRNSVAVWHQKQRQQKQKQVELFQTKMFLSSKESHQQSRGFWVHACALPCVSVVSPEHENHQYPVCISLVHILKTQSLTLRFRNKVWQSLFCKQVNFIM